MSAEHIMNIPAVEKLNISFFAFIRIDFGMHKCITSLRMQFSVSEWQLKKKAKHFFPLQICAE